jgi:hypothetical protein
VRIGQGVYRRVKACIFQTDAEAAFRFRRNLSAVDDVWFRRERTIEHAARTKLQLHPRALQKGRPRAIQRSSEGPPKIVQRLVQRLVQGSYRARTRLVQVPFARSSLLQTDNTDRKSPACTAIKLSFGDRSEQGDPHYTAIHSIKFIHPCDTRYGISSSLVFCPTPTTLNTIEESKCVLVIYHTIAYRTIRYNTI